MTKFAKAGTSPANYGSIDVAEGIFSGAGTLQRIMTVEAALAKVEAELGIIPTEAAKEIKRKANVDFLNEEEYEKHRKATGHSLMGLLRAYKAICENGAGEYIHYGTTTQDINDTAIALQMKDTYEIVEQKLKQIRDIIRAKTIQYKSLVMIGRTNDQQALPITLGFKMASWLDEVERDLERLNDSKKRVLVGQFGGAVGTMDSLGEKGLEVRDGLMKELSLGIPKIAWYASRDRYAEYTTTLAMICGTLGRIGNEIYIGQKTEVNELAEGYGVGKVGSSTMPHKRNPFIPARLSGFGRMARSIVMDSFLVMESTNERDTRNLRVEPYFLKRISCLADGSCDTAIELLENLEVREDSISRNLNLLGGLIYSEALMMRLSENFGRMEAHDIIHGLAQKAILEKQNFLELILADERVTNYIPMEELNQIMNPAAHTGLSEYFVDVVAGTGFC